MPTKSSFFSIPAARCPRADQAPSSSWLVVLLAVAGCTPSKDMASPSTSLSDASPKRMERVTAGPPLRQTLRWVTELPGRVLAYESAPIQSKVSGYVEAVEVDLGDAVAKGQTILRIRAPEYQDQLQQKQQLLLQSDAEIQQTQSAVIAALASVRSADAMILQAEANLEGAQADSDRSSSEAQRIGQLAGKGAVTSKIAEESANQSIAAQASRKEARAIIELAKAKKAEAEALVKTAEAEVEKAKAKRNVLLADLQYAQTMLDYTLVTSPMDGHVTSRAVDVGHFVEPAGVGSIPLLTIANDQKVRVRVEVPEQEAAWVDAETEAPRRGDPATLFLRSSPEATIEARITRTNRQLSSDSRTLTAEIELDQMDQKLIPGFFVTVKILLEERPDVFTLPTSAIIKSEGRSRCYVVVDGQTQLRELELGLKVADAVEIRSGLDGSETVVLTRANAVQPGQPVEVFPPK